eukprot:5676253-Pyramimonas_sp.AAC.1
MQQYRDGGPINFTSKTGGDILLDIMRVFVHMRAHSRNLVPLANEAPARRTVHPGAVANND